jgi:hypothetical protein
MKPTKISKRLLLLIAVLLGIAFGSFQVPSTTAQIEIFYDSDSGDSGGWYCPITDVTVNGKTCTAVGCHAYSNSDPTMVCSYRSSDGRGGCPPLEQCQN